MADLFNYLDSTSYKNIIWLIPIILLFHELEEWNILKWYKENYIELPPSTNRSIRVWLIGISIVGFVWTAVCYLIPNNSVAAFLICWLVAITLQNGFQHLYWLFCFKKYAPGVIFSVLFGIPADIYICFRIIIEELLPFWLVIFMMLLIIPGLIETVKAKNRMTKGVRGAHELGIKVANRLWK